MKATIFVGQGNPYHIAVVLNDRGYQLGRRAFDRNNQGLGEAKLWLEEHWDFPADKIAVENLEETEVWFLFNGTLMDNEAQQQIMQPKLFRTVAEAQEWLNGQYDEKCPITIKAGKRIGDNVVAA